MRSIKKKTGITFINILFFTAVAFSQNVRLNVNVLLHPNTGLPPSYMRSSTTSSLAQLQAIEYIDIRIDYANNVLSKYDRNLMLVREPVTFIGGIAAQQHYSSTSNDDFENAAENDPAAYNWSNNKINYYFIVADDASSCSFPPGLLNPLSLFSDEIIVQRRNGFISTMLHEIGHFFNLCHTHGCACTDSEGCADVIFFGDLIDDTLKDAKDWDQDDIAIEEYGVNYAACTSSQRDMVDSVFFNIMSYHNNRNILTGQQLDRWGQSLYDFQTREDVVSTMPLYVDKGNGCVDVIDPCTGGPENDEFPNLHTGDDNAYQNVDSDNELVVIRDGTYDEGAFIWTKKCLIVSDGEGSAVIE